MSLVGTLLLGKGFLNLNSQDHKYDYDDDDDHVIAVNNPSLFDDDVGDDDNNEAANDIKYLPYHIILTILTIIDHIDQAMTILYHIDHESGGRRIVKSGRQEDRGE